MTDTTHTGLRTCPCCGALPCDQAMTPTAPQETAGEAVAWPDTCDGIEQDAFEAWAKSERMDMHEHPLHYLFLDAKTYAARKGWKAGLVHAVKRMKDHPTPAAATTDNTALVEADNLKFRICSVLLGHHLTESHDEDGFAYPLVEALTPEDGDVKTGELEIMSIADKLVTVLASRPAEASTDTMTLVKAAYSEVMRRQKDMQQRVPVQMTEMEIGRREGRQAAYRDCLGIFRTVFGLRIGDIAEATSRERVEEDEFPRVRRVREVLGSGLTWICEVSHQQRSFHRTKEEAEARCAALTPKASDEEDGGYNGD